LKNLNFDIFFITDGGPKIIIMDNIMSVKASNMFNNKRGHINHLGMTSDKSLGPRGLFPLWSQVRAMWLLI
jgi:hypothetical protein